MHFLFPNAFFFAAAIPVVIVFYLLKRKRIAKLVPSTLLWRKFLSDTQANAPFQRLRHNWLLILQVLLLALVILALSRPYFAARKGPPVLRIVILDASASMQATDEAPSRFEKARAEAIKWVNALSGNDQMTLLLAAANTEVKQSATGDKSALRRALEGCRVTDAPAHLADALKLGRTLIRDSPDAEIHLFSDGASAQLREFENKGLPLIFHRVGRRGDNAAIVALDVRANPENARERAIYLSVVNYGSNSVQGPLELRFENQLIESRQITVGPGQAAPQVFLAAQPGDGIFTARFDVKDDLALDNSASIVSLLPQLIRITLVTRGNRFLEKALRAVPEVSLTVAGEFNSNLPTDIVVLDDVTPGQFPRGNLLAFHVASTNWLVSEGTLEAPPIVFWRNNHALLRHVTFDNVQVAESISVRPPSWATAIVEGPKAPLILAGELGRQRIVWTGFDVLKSTWPLRISFPIFIANAIDWLNPAGTASSQLLVRAGEPLRLRLNENTADAEVLLPNGEARKIRVDQVRGEAVFAETARQGIYRLREGTRETRFCVNLLSPSESNLHPADELALGKYSRAPATTLKRADMELWRWIAAAGLAMLLIEWWYYHRRTA